MELFLKYKTVIMRSLGAILLIVGFAVHFWVTPKKGLSANDKAAARVARMEASAKGSTPNSSDTKKKDDTKFLKKLQEKQAQQMQYMMIVVMVIGVGFLAYSFIPAKQEETL